MPRCQEKVKKKMKIQEDGIANSVGSGGVAGMTEPVVRKRGKFAGHDTFMMTREAFNGLKFQKRKGAHWKGYLEEDDAYKELREYANRHKGPVVVQCETTGACMFVRYGDGPLFEAVENNVKNTKQSKRSLSDAGKKASEVRKDVRLNYGKHSHLGTFKSHRVHRTTFGKGDAAYHLQDPETGEITHSVNGEEKRGVLTVDGASSTGKSKIKMHDFYHHLIKKHINAIVGTSHSEGAKKVWQKLGSKQGVSIHGWHKGKAVNLDHKDEMDTHAPDRSGFWKDNREPEEKTVAATDLVASYHKKGAKKL